MMMMMEEQLLNGWELEDKYLIAICMLLLVVFFQVSFKLTQADDKRQSSLTVKD